MPKNLILRLTLMLMFILICSLPLLAAERTVNVSPSPNNIFLMNNTQSGFDVEYNIGEYKLMDVQTKAGNFDQLLIDGYAFTTQVGEPKLPLLRKIVAVPVGAEVRFSITSRNQVNISAMDSRLNHKIIPAQEPISKSDDPALLPFIFNSASYAKDRYTANELFSVTDMGYMRGVRIFAIDFVPVAYNPVNGSLQLTQKLGVRVDFINPDFIATENLRAKTASVEFENLYGKVLFNWRDEDRVSLVRYPTKMLILTPANYVSTLAPYITWKKQQGYNVTVTTVGTGGTVANTTTAIQTYMNSVWSSATAQDPAPTYLLIVGDTSTTGDNIISNTGVSSTAHVTDLTYVRLQGTDYIPEIYYGRFSVSSATELTNIINKTLMFQKTAMPDLSYLGKTVLIAGVDASFAPTHGNGALNYGTTHYFNATNGITSNTYLYPASGSSSAAIIANANEGRGYMNYTAHGSETSWADPSFTVTNVNNMTNTDKYFVAVGNCCITNKFNYTGGACFGEAIIRAANKAGVAYIGGNNNTYWDEDYWWAVGFKTPVQANAHAYSATSLGAYDAMFHTHSEAVENWAQTLGETVFMGNMAVEQSTTSRKSYYWEIYSIMGDPSLMPYYGVPPVNTATYPSQILIGANSITVTAAAQSRVALSMNGVLYGTGIVGSTGSLNLAITPFTGVGTAQLVITRSNRRTVIADVQIIPNSGAYVSVSTVNYADSNNNSPDYNESGRFNVTFQNVGSAAATNVTATLTCSTAGISISDNTETIASLAAGASSTINNAFSFNIANNIVNGTSAAFTITMVSGTNTWVHNFTLTLNAPQLAMGSMIIQDPSGNNNGRLDPGETVTIIMPLSNTGASTSLAGTATVTCSTTGISIISGSTNFTAISAGASANLSFSISASSSISIGTVANLVFNASAGQYTANKTEATAVGLILEDFETGNFNAYPWTFSGNANWTIDGTSAQSGTYSAKSGTITHSQNTSMQTTRILTTGGNISFWYKVSSESGYDYLKFYVDGVLQNIPGWAGSINWTQATYALAAGTRVLKWEYMKDGSVSSNSDCAWIDNIIFPASTGPSTFNPPQNFSANASFGVVNLAWQAPASGTPTSYKIFKNSVLLTSVTSLSYTDTAVTNGTSYTYYLKAVYSGGESDPTQSLSVTPNAVAPTNLTAVAGNGFVNLSWTAATGRAMDMFTRSSSEERAISGYKIYRNGTALTTITGTTYQDTNVVNETSYTYYVTTVYTNPAGESSASNTVQATPTAQTAIEAILGSGITITSNSTSSPVNIYYRSRHGQMVYTAAELNAAGIAGPINITQLGFHVETAPIYAMPSYIIRMKHTTATDVTNIQTLAGMTTVYTNLSYLPPAGGFDMLTLSTPFLWNGVDNIVVDFAFAIVSPNYNSSGTTQYTTITNGYRHWQSDSADQSAVFTGGTLLTSRPNIKMLFAPVTADPAFSISPSSKDFGTVLLGANATQQFTVSNTGGGTLSISNISIQGSNNYSILNAPTLPLSLGSGISATFDVRFAPTSEGQLNASLILVDNRATHTVTLTGTGLDAQITTFPWTEDFSSFPPTAWDLTGGTQNWAQYTTGTNPSAYASLWSWQSPNNALLTTPPLRPTAASKLSFKWSHQYNATYPNDAMRVSYSTDNTNWTELWYKVGTEFNSNDGAASTTPGSFVTAELDLPAGHTAQAFFIRFDAISGFGPNVYIDDVSITPLPTSPIIVVNPTSIDFAEVAQGTSTQLNFTIQNAGSQTLTGSITTPANYHVSTGRSDRNTQGFNIAAASSQVFTLTFSPTAAQAYNGNIVISSNASNNPTLNLPVTGSGYVPPTIALSADYLSASIPAGDEDTRSFVISNSGSRPLTFTLGMEEFSDRNARNNRGLSTSAAKDRNISGSTLTLDTDSYQAGTSIDWTFSVYNASTDTEWLKDVFITFPQGVTVNSVTNFTGGTGELVPDLTSGTNITINWHGVSGEWGVIHGGETATATVNVSIAANNTAPINLAYQIDGDDYGTEPHSLSGTITLNPDVPPVLWLSCSPMSGTVEPGQSLPIDVLFSAVNMDMGDYIAVISVFSNDPVNGEKTIDAEMVVGAFNHAPTINLPNSFSFDKNANLSVDFSSYIFDADGDPMTLQVSGNQNVNVQIQGSLVTFSAVQNWIGTEQLSFTVTDGTAFASDNVSVTVNPVNLPDWEPVIYPNNPATIYGVITIEGIPAQMNDLVAAFVGEECRGTAEVIIVNRNTAYATLLVQLNQPNEILSIKVYSYAQDIIYDVDQTYQLGYGEVLGEDEPIEIDGTALLALQTPSPSLIAGSTSVRIQWEAIPNADRYKVYGSNNPTSGFSLLGTTSLTYWDDDLILEGKRFFYILAEKTTPAK